MIELRVINGTDKEIRFEVHIDGNSKGELMMDREDFSKFADLIFGRNYKVVTNVPTLDE